METPQFEPLLNSAERHELTPYLYMAIELENNSLARAKSTRPSPPDYDQSAGTSCYPRSNKFYATQREYHGDGGH